MATASAANILYRVLESFEEDEGYREGFTIHAASGQDQRQLPIPHYLVGGIIPALIISKSQKLTELKNDIEEWLKGVAVLDGNAAWVGGWPNPDDDDFIHIDLITFVSTKEEALLLGRLWKQREVGHFVNGEFIEIFVGAKEEAE